MMLEWGMRMRRGVRLGRFGRDRRGVSAIEFAIVALPFFALLFAILETALVFLAGQLFESSVAHAARLIRTGQVDESFTPERFKTEICEHAVIFSNCESGVFLDVRVFETFAETAEEASTPPIGADDEFEGEEFFDPGEGSDIVLVRAYYQWPLTVPSFGIDLADLSNGRRLIAAGAAFRNEPFGQ